MLAKHKTKSMNSQQSIAIAIRQMKEEEDIFEKGKVGILSESYRSMKEALEIKNSFESLFESTEEVIDAQYKEVQGAGNFGDQVMNMFFNDVTKEKDEKNPLGRFFKKN